MYLCMYACTYIYVCVNLVKLQNYILSTEDLKFVAVCSVNPISSRNVPIFYIFVMCAEHAPSEDLRSCPHVKKPFA